MVLFTTEDVITGMAWTVLCLAAVVYMPIWHLLVSVLISINILLLVFIMHSFFKRSTFKHIQIIFDVVWSPLVNMFNYSKVQLMEPNLQGQSKLFPFDRGIPPWGRHHAFIVSIIALHCASSADIVIYISWVIFLNSLLLIVKEKVGSGENKDTKCNYSLDNDIAIQTNLMSRSVQDVAYTTHLWFWTVHSTICVLCITFNCLSMTLTNVCITILFVCSTYSQIQLRAMTQFKESYPYFLDGLGELAVLGLLILMDIIMNGSLFFSAFNTDSSLLFVCLTYCNAFAAFMEFHVRVWLPLRNERFLIGYMRRATQEELVLHNDVCAICLVGMTSARVTVCQHMFHGKCLRLSLKNSAQCPLCKSALVPSCGHTHIFS